MMKTYRSIEPMLLYVLLQVSLQQCCVRTYRISGGTWEYVPKPARIPEVSQAGYLSLVDSTTLNSGLLYS